MKKLLEKYEVVSRYVRRCGGLFIVPDSIGGDDDDDYIIQLDVEGYFVCVKASSIDTEILDCLRSNHRAFCAMLRRGCEVGI